MDYDRFLMMNKLIHRYYKIHFVEIEKEFQITHIELQILLLIDSDPTYNTASIIIKNGSFVKSHVSSSIDRLVKMGYLERTTTEYNKKTIVLKLLPASEVIIKRAKKRKRAFFNYIFQGLDEYQLKMHDDISNVIMENIEAYIKGEK